MTHKTLALLCSCVLLLTCGIAAGADQPVMNHKGMTSKLGLLFLGGHPSDTLQGMLDDGNIPIMKIPAEDFTRPDSIGLRLKKANPKSIIVVGIGAQGSDMKIDRDPAEVYARWEKEKEGQLNILKAHRDKVDFLSFMPNMWEPKRLEQAEWYNRYIAIAAPRVAAMGFRPVILQSGMGGLPDQPEILDAMVPAFRIAKQHGGAWACHGYTMEYTTDLEKEQWTSLRHRRAYNYLKQAHPDVADLSMIQMEGGVDKAGNPDQDGYLARGSTEKFIQWLKWFDAELMKDPQVLGVCLFKIGDPGSWKSFDVEPIAPWLRAYLKAKAAPKEEPKEKN